MTLERKFDTNFNLKKIRRIMKEYSIICHKRRINPYKTIAKATQEHRVHPNILKRKFKQNDPYKVLLTDITYLTYGNGKRAYLSTIKDSATNELLSYKVSSNLKVDFVIDTVKDLFKSGRKLHKSVLLHSDQGFHYTNPRYQYLLKSKKITQSVSRRGNCWDNAPMESFFGHYEG